MPNPSQILDLADLLAAEGTLDTDLSATDTDVRTAAEAAVAAIRDAYRIAYKNVGGDVDNDMVDALDAAEITIRDALTELTSATASLSATVLTVGQPVPDSMPIVCCGTPMAVEGDADGIDRECLTCGTTVTTRRGTVATTSR